MKSRELCWGFSELHMGSRGQGFVSSDKSALFLGLDKTHGTKSLKPIH
jgi:hypothetical protein